MRSRFFLGEVADSVIRSNKNYYQSELIDLIPDKLLDTEFNSKNGLQLIEKLDRLRFKKEKELAAMLDNPKKLKEAINSSRNNLSEKQERKKKEIKFLFNVAAALLHWTN